MNCADLLRLLALDDAAARPDRIRISEHLRGCAPCRGSSAEILPLLSALEAATVPARAARTARVLRKLGLCAAAALLLSTALALHRAGSTGATGQSAAQLAADTEPRSTLVGHVRPVVMASSTIQSTTVHYRPDRKITWASRKTTRSLEPWSHSR